MHAQPTLSDREWMLIMQLLEQERQELPPEIHHTDSPKYQDDLQQRLRLVDSVLTKIRSALPAATTT